MNGDEFVEHLALVLDVPSLELVCRTESITVTLVLYDLLLNHTLTELKLIDAVDETFLRNKLAGGLHRHALDCGGAVFSRV